MNILTGIFVDNAMKLCKLDDLEALMESKKKINKDWEELLCIMNVIDTDCNGSLSVEEFLSAMDNERVVHALRCLGVDIKDAALFFQTMSHVTDTEEMSIEEF